MQRASFTHAGKAANRAHFAILNQRLVPNAVQAPGGVQCI